jgi:O-antigen/teichoic acid export membrane protein
MLLKQKAQKSVFWSFLEQLPNQIIGFGISFALARLLMPEDCGLIAMLAIFMGIGGALISSGLTQSLIRTENPDDADFNLFGSLSLQ